MLQFQVMAHFLAPYVPQIRFMKHASVLLVETLRHSSYVFMTRFFFGPSVYETHLRFFQDMTSVHASFFFIIMGSAQPRRGRGSGGVGG